MKRVFAILLSIAMVLSLVGCNTAGNNSNSASVPETTTLKEGIYEASADGMNGAILLEVAFDKEGITDILVKESSESEGIGTSAFDLMIPEIIENQSVGIDTISGATITSKALIAAVSDAIKQAGGDINKFSKAPEKEAKADQVTKDVDIVIAGSGIAGLSAAVEASATGKTVLVIEKMPIIGGDSAICSGNIYATGSKVQDDLGLTDNGTVEDLKNFYIKQGDSHISEEWAELTAKLSGQSVDWLAEKGLTFKHRSPDSSHRSLISESSGVGIVNALAKRAESQGTEILTNTEAKELIFEDGEVKGIIADNKGTKMIINAKSVILATGGYDGSEEAKAKYAPGSVGHHSNSSKGNTGDAIEMVQKINGKIVLKGGLSGISLVGDLPLHSPLSALRMIKTSVAVTDLGYRYVNESMTSAFDYYNPMVRTGRAQFYNIVDSTTYNELYDQAVEENVAFKANTIEELAKLAGIPSYTLKTTIEDYNKACAAGKDAEFSKDSKDLQPLVKAPFYAIKITPNTNDSFGGVVTNLDTEVLDINDQPIKNLYAAGAVSNGELFYLRYPVSGSSLNMGTTFGRISGQKAIENIK